MRDQPCSLKFSLAVHRQAHTVAAEHTKHGNYNACQHQTNLYATVYQLEKIKSEIFVVVNMWENQSIQGQL